MTGIVRLWVLWAAAVALAVVDGLGRLTFTGRRAFGQAPLVWFDATDEWTIPTLFTVAVTALVGLCCLRWRSPQRSRWRLLGGLFVWLAVDDLFGVHEWVGELAHPWLSSGPIYAWVLALGPVFAVTALACVVRIRRDLPSPRLEMLCGGFAMLALALVAEAGEGVVGGLDVRVRGIPLIDYTQWFEECLELLAPVLLLAAVRPLPPAAVAPTALTLPGASRNAAPAR